MTASYPERIVCLTEETTETLYLLGEEDRIVGISGFTVRPPQARKEKPKVSLFTSANTEEIVGLAPDLVLGFSDLQADVARDLVKCGLTVMIFNHRSVQEILNFIMTLGGLIGASDRAGALVEELEAGLDKIRDAASRLERRPRVYFEEWDDPLITGIKWVSELVELAGGIDCFAENREFPHAKDRIIADPMEVVSRQPEIIIGSWCGKMFKPEKVKARDGWGKIEAVRENRLHEVKSAEILQPGPAALTVGVKKIHEIIMAWAGH
jgi:iron complex transport system substrate-binding protein